MQSKILIVTYSLKIGGIQKSLISLLNSIELSKYHIDLILFEKTGELINHIPDYVNIIDAPDYMEKMMIPKESWLKVISKMMNNPIESLNYFYNISKGIVLNNMNMSRQSYWIRNNCKLSDFDKEYDVAIAYHGLLDAYFIADKVKSKKKICWVHSDYKILKRNKKIDKYYYEKFDVIVGVSDTCVSQLLSFFPRLSDNTTVINNIVSRKQIMTLVDEGSGFIDNFDGVRLLDVSRLDPMKGFDIAIPVIKRLLNDGYNIKYYIIGDGPEKDRITELISSHNLDDFVVLLGQMSNPYRYIRESDIFVHPSRFEGKSVAIDEALLLEKPVIIMDYKTARDQIIDGENGMIADMSEDGLYDKLKFMLDNEPLMRKIKLNLMNVESDEDESIMKFYEVLGM